ncbi:hypothetical protein GF312_20840 [Candidatus Poribacteria bacterium]|nr:hypothetical protein [Candidatus Poribacteria bacterium]
MPHELNSSFKTRRLTRYKPDHRIVNCEKIYIGDVDCDGQQEIVIPKNCSSNGKETGEIVVYDMELNQKAKDSWKGSAMDVVVKDIDDDGIDEIIVAGSIENSYPFIRTFKYNTNYRDNLTLISQIAWKAPEKLYSTAKALCVSDLDGDGKAEISVLSITEGKGSENGYIQLRIYDHQINLRKIAKWTPMTGSIVKWGHCMTTADIDGDGCDELITLVNFRHQGKQKSDIRVFSPDLMIKNKCDAIKDEAMFATCMLSGDIYNDGKIKLVVAGGVFSQVWQGATNQLMILDEKLEITSKTTWKTFRHSWVWDIQLADLDNNDKKKIITYGGVSTAGRNQEDSYIMGEIRIWNNADLSTRDMYIWQSSPGVDTRPSRGFAFNHHEKPIFITATSRWRRHENPDELEIRIMDYNYKPNAINHYSSLIKAYEDSNANTLASLALPENEDFTPLAVEALWVRCADETPEIINQLLTTKNKPLFRRVVGVLKFLGDKGKEELRKIGFIMPELLAIASPFDNNQKCGFEKKYPPETGIDLQAYYAGKGRIVRWSKLDYYKYDPYIDLAYAHFDSFERTGIEYFWNEKKTESTAYLLTHIEASSDCKIQIRLGSSDPVKMWVDNDLKLSSDKVSKAKPDQHTSEMDLSKGSHNMMLKVANINNGEWGIYLRITDNEGKPISDINYALPEVEYKHNQVIAVKELLKLVDSTDENLQFMAASQLACSQDRRGNEVLYHLLDSEDDIIRFKAALALTRADDPEGVETLVETTPNQDHLLQLAAGHALKRLGDPRGEQFYPDNLKDKNDRKVVELDVDKRGKDYRVSPKYKGDETSHVQVGVNRDFHLGNNISAKSSTIESFGIRKPIYRAMGLGSMAISKACEIMAEQGYSCSTVSTGTRLVAHRLYCRNGYVDRRSPWHYGRSLKDELSIKGDEKINVREYTEADKSEIDRLREDYSQNTVGPNEWSPRSNYGSWIRVAEEEDKIIGYTDVHLDPFEPKAEINLIHIDPDYKDENKAVKSILAHIHDYVKNEGKEQINYHDPTMGYRETILSAGYMVDPSCKRYGWVNMFKVINLPKFLEEISDLLEMRLKKSINAGWQGSIGISGSRLKSTLEIDKDCNINVKNDNVEKADLVIVADDKTITNLVCCNEDIWESYRQHTFTVKPVFNERIRLLIESLFPLLPWKQGGWW